jgi:hypothetical protein
VDDIGRYKGRRAHCLSGATADRSGEGIWLREAPSPEQILTAGVDDFCAISGLRETTLGKMIKERG